MIGNWFPKSNFKDVNAINFSLKRNDKIVQSGNTQFMLWKIDEIIAYVPQFFTLKIGNIIFTGTPSGVGKVSENDILTGYIENEELFRIKVK